MEMTKKEFQDIFTQVAQDELNGIKSEVIKAMEDNVAKTLADIEATKASSETVYNGDKETEIKVYFGRAVKAVLSYKMEQKQGNSVGDLKSYQEKFINKHYANDTKYMSHVKDIMSAQGDGGLLVKEDWADFIIDELLKATFLDKLGVNRIMINDNLNIPVVLDGILAGFVGEMEGIDASKITLGSIRLEKKILKSMALVTNYLLETNSYSADILITNNMLRNMRVVLEESFLYGEGNGKQPKGADKLKGKLTVGSGTTELERSLLVKAIAKFGENNYDVNASEVTFLINWEAWEKLQNETQANGNLVNYLDMAQGKLVGIFPFVVTNIVKSGEFFLIKGSDVYVANVGQIEVKASTDASVSYNGGSLSLWETGVTAFLAEGKFDFGFARDIAVLKGTYKVA